MCDVMCDTRRTMYHVRCVMRVARCVMRGLRYEVCGVMRDARCVTCDVARVMYEV